MFSTVLIANRGEIALRVARTCRELGVRTVAVYSTADRESAVVRFADEAIHPGFGFLSEDPDFAEICLAHGITFLGPPPAVMARLGDKAAARASAADAGLPILPGTCRTLKTAADAVEVADDIGYPLIVKAAAGGGGRGMKEVFEPRELLRSYKETRAVAQAVFGDGSVYLERLLETARHVEIQVLCDRQDHAVYLGERDCSVQRRHQKLIEETPAPGVPTDLTARMGEAAVQGARAVGFVGAGTFEFLVDEADNFYFMEINPRIQVEHPVTEMVTGIDIVREQLAVAAGHPLSISQADVVPRGVAIECRVNAEDPDRDFAPTPGLLSEFTPPGGPFTRVDTHGYTGSMVTPDYDSLLAKLIVWAPDRDGAIARMDRALGEFRVGGSGVRTTIGFLREVLAHPLFRDAKHTTSLVQQMFAPHS